MSRVEGRTESVFPLGPKPERNPRVWLTRHVYALVSTLGQIVRTPFNTLATAAVIAVAIALPAGLYVTLENVRGITRGWEGGARISLYLSPVADAEEAKRLADSLRGEEGVDRIEVIPPAQALEEYEQLTGFQGLDGAFGGENPLPTVLVLFLSMEHSSSSTANRLTSNLSKRPGVDLVQSDSRWMERLQALLEVFSRAILILGALLGMGIALIVGNTIRLNIQNRHDEIEVCKLIGATDAFVRRPFLYIGAWYGLLGGLLAWMLILTAIELVQGPVHRLALLYHTQFELAGPSPLEVAALLLGGVFLGLTGAWVSVIKHLREIELA